MRRIAVAALAALSACAVGLSQPEPSVVPAVGHGLSAIEVTDGGTAFVALSDRGIMIHGRFLRSAGRLNDVVVVSENRLKNAEGEWPASVNSRDSEGLALAADGTVFVSYEGRHRVAHHRADGALIETMPAPIRRGTNGNRGIEALARAPDGTFYALPEKQGGPLPIWRRGPGEPWAQIAELPSRAGYAPAGADIGPDGRLYILERAFLGVGFAARVLRVETDGSGLSTVLDLPLGRHGNLEGLSIWRDGAGRLRATMVEDDNFQSFQRGGIVEYVLE
ncbi:MAG: hypothetical protein CSA72_05860 [Rhodobacterales bacterium]|nr:MAG: hypothetical protein CSA72_05860 [Rhodobacterales bacterium]